MYTKCVFVNFAVLDSPERAALKSIEREIFPREDPFFLCPRLKIILKLSLPPILYVKAQQFSRKLVPDADPCKSDTGEKSTALKKMI